MSQEKARLEELISKLKQERDELRVQIHLAKAEAKDEWEELEKKWEVLENKLAALKKETKVASKDIGAALGILSEEIAKAYKRMLNRRKRRLSIFDDRKLSLHVPCFRTIVWILNSC